MSSIAPIQSRALDQNLAPAGFWLRFFAYILDSYIIGIICIFAITAIFATAFAAVSIADIDLTALNSPDVGEKLEPYAPLIALVFIIPFAFQLLYFALFESSSLRSTPGKWLLGLRVTDIEDQRVGFATSFMRNIYKALPLIIFFLSIVIGFLVATMAPAFVFVAPLVVLGGGIFSGILVLVFYLRIAFSEAKQGLHDLWSDAQVQKQLDFSSTRRVGFSLLAIFLLFFGSFQGGSDIDFDDPPRIPRKIADKSVLQESAQKPSSVKKTETNAAPAVSAVTEEVKEEEPTTEIAQKDDFFTKPFPSEDPSRAINILNRGKEIEKGGLRNAETDVNIIQPVVIESLSGTARIGNKTLRLVRINAQTSKDKKSILVNFYGAAKTGKSFSVPTLKILLSYKSSLSNCQRKELQGYVIKFRPEHFGVKLPNDMKYISMKRSGSDVILNESMKAWCQLNDGKNWIRLDTKGADASLIQGTRYSLQWLVKADKFL